MYSIKKIPDAVEYCGVLYHSERDAMKAAKLDALVNESPIDGIEDHTELRDFLIDNEDKVKDWILADNISTKDYEIINIDSSEVSFLVKKGTDTHEKLLKNRSLSEGYKSCR